MRNFIIAWSRRIKWVLTMLAKGQFRILTIDFTFRVYRAFYVILFYLLLPLRRRKERTPGTINVKTDFPVA